VVKLHHTIPGNTVAITPPFSLNFAILLPETFTHTFAGTGRSKLCCLKHRRQLAILIRAAPLLLSTLLKPISYARGNP
jgi:hypothetical protein